MNPQPYFVGTIEIRFEKLNPHYTHTYTGDK